MTEAATATARRSVPWAILAAFAAGCALVALMSVTRAQAQEDTGNEGSTSETESGTDTDTGDEESCDEHHGKGGHRLFGRGGLGEQADQMAELIGIETDALHEELKSGKSLADVANDNGIAPQTLVDAIVDAIGERVDTLLEEDLIDSEKAEEIRADASTIAEKIVDRERSVEDGEDDKKGRRDGRHHRGPIGSVARAAVDAFT